MIIGKKSNKTRFPASTLKTYFKKGGASHQELIGFGEPYFVNGPYRNLACIKLFGPGSFWRKTHGPIDIVGEAVDPVDPDELKYILESRREGEIYGRWYSQFCPFGEFGFLNYRVAEKISQDTYKELLEKVKSDVTKQ